MPQPVRVTTVEGHEQQGDTAHRPVSPPYGFFYFDVDVGISLCWNGSEWRPASSGTGTTAERPAASTVPRGTLFYNLDSASVEFSDGVAWLLLTQDDNQSSSSSSPSSSTNSSSTTSSEGTSSSPSSLSSQSTSSENSSSTSSSSFVP